MRRFAPIRWLPLLIIGALASLPAVPARGENVASLQAGQRVRGTVPAKEVVRLTFPLAKGAEPRLNFSLKGSRTTVSFRKFTILDPRGDPVVLPPDNNFFRLDLSPKKSTLKLRNWVAPESGSYQVLIETNSLIATQANGKLKVSRPKRIKFEGNATVNKLLIGLQPSDRYKVVVKRKKGGDSPEITGIDIPSLNRTFRPIQVLKDKSTKTGFITARNFDVYGLNFGYQAGGSSGDYKAKVTVKPLKRSGFQFLRLTNAPGIPISVRANDASRAVTFGNTGCGVAFDPIGGNILITSEQNGEIHGQLFDTGLFELPQVPNPTRFVGPADVQGGGPGGEVISGHRLIYFGGHYYVLWTTASGNVTGIMKRSTSLSRVASIADLLPSHPNPIRDPFFISDGATLSVGVLRPSDGHTVYRFDADRFLPLIPAFVDIGGGTDFAHVNGAGVAWCPPPDLSGSGEFELWAPDSLVPTDPSDLHRLRYSDTWSILQPADDTPVADVVTETMPTAVTIDVDNGGFDPLTRDPLETGVTIVHYVEPVDANGNGFIHRRIYDVDGNPVPVGQTDLFEPIYDAVLELTQRNRPFSVIVGNSLYLATDGASGPRVDRYEIVRSFEEDEEQEE